MTEKSKPDAAKAAKPKKQWSNPALRAMGIPRFSLPSRNWMIFCSVLASVGGSIYYDKQQQKAVRDRYVAQVAHLANEECAANRLPRKLTVFIAPPPNDFLEESLRHFRRYIKPILDAAAIDFDVYTEMRQGDIRAQVAEKIRQLRRAQAEQQRAAAEKQVQEAREHSWRPEHLVSRAELYEVKDLLGLYRVVEPTKPVCDHVDDAALCGGVVCIGRGSYKEYLTGIHEGFLGPLEAPVVEAGLVGASKISQKSELFDADASSDAQLSVPVPFISATDYKNCVLAPEFDFSQNILSKDGVPVLFEQPVYVFPVPKISGFTRIPEKIYNYFTRRKLAEDVSEKTLVVVHGKSRPFEYKDKYLASEEELDWPKKWVEKGKAKKSEWVQKLEVDDRVTRRLRVFDR
ncbi:hypothetical protein METBISCDRAFT_11800 [Metschnikowia bicuspidata]|uniref:Mitochondrial import inner membrane translocase subunit TIM54 n=1 Tax=Metschnikowia bicuspidata TaxID=27322 RepID=A0A4P9ZJN5_9ASCO|nr:hypothetical protein METBISCDRAFT_11800 [Metschnikowia bicuspidata]